MLTGTRSDIARRGKLALSSDRNLCPQVTRVLARRCASALIGLWLAFLAPAQKVKEITPPEKWQLDGILAALDDPVRKVQVRALAEIKNFSRADNVAAKRLSAKLSDSNEHYRVLVILALGAIGAKQTAPDLLLQLRDSYPPYLRSAALEALAAMQAKEYSHEIAKLIGDKHVRISAIKALGTLQSKEFAPEIVKLLSEQDEIIRLAATNALVDMRATELAQAVLKLLEDTDANVRFSAARGLGGLSAMDTVPQLLGLLKSSTAHVRVSAVTALAAMDARNTVSAVAKLLKDSDRGVRLTVVEALGTLQDRVDAPEIVKLLGDSDPEMRRTAVGALSAMGLKEHASTLVKFLKDKDIGVRFRAAIALGTLAAKETVPQVMELLKSSNVDVRLSATEALAAMRAKESAAQVALLLEDPNDQIQAAAAKALGVMQAREFVPKLVPLMGNSSYSNVRSSASTALSSLHARESLPQLVALLNSSASNDEVRSDVAWLIGFLQGKESVRELVKLLHDPNEHVRWSGVGALSRLAPLPRSVAADIADAYYAQPNEQEQFRFLSYYVTGGDPDVVRVIRQTMFEPGQRRGELKGVDEARATLAAFHNILPAQREGTRFADDAENQILRIAGEWKNEWAAEDEILFKQLSGQMSVVNGDSLTRVIAVPWWRTALQAGWKAISLQVALWALLIWAYPISPHVQAFFFWNKWPRKFLGLFYVDLFLTWVPFLRARLLAPFKGELAAGAQVGGTPQEYFSDVQISTDGGPESSQPQPAAIVIPSVHGQMILEGESGLGKSMFVRSLIESTAKPIAYLQASDCGHGVLEAIQRKLRGKAADEAFLSSIIYSGGLQIAVDGLNEVTVETRETIRRFLDDFPKAHVLLATQPLQWKRPHRMRVFQLQKLDDQRILRFLESRYASFAPPISMDESAYKKRCMKYLDSVFCPNHSEEDRASARLVLSNPMDLTTAARILVSGGEPTLKRLQEQQFELVLGDFLRTHPGQEFPLRHLAQSIYERRLKDELSLEANEAFFPAIQTMAAHKMVLERNELDAAGKPTRNWVFRHDKIRDYFLMQAMLNRSPVPDHVDDPRFRGVYLMLAQQLPFEDARTLRDAVVERAAETRDYHLMTAVVEVIKARKGLPSAASAAAKQN